MWEGEIVEERVRRRSEGVSQSVFQAKIGDGSVRRQELPLIPGRERQEAARSKGKEVGGYPPRNETHGAGMSMATNPKWSSFAKPIKVE